MKTIAATLCLYLIAATTLFSFPMTELIGFWSYQNRATESDGDVLRTQGFIRAKRKASGNYVFEETNATGDPVASYTIFSDGRFKLTQGPAVSASGRWRKTADAIKVSGKITTPLGTHRFTTKFTKPSADDLVIVQRVPFFDTVSKWTAQRTNP